jgi:hypothetical protein
MRYGNNSIISGKCDMEKITAIKTELIDEIRQRILPFWFKFSTNHENGVFYGRVDNRGKAVPDAPKSLILYTRILWTFTDVDTLIDYAVNIPPDGLTSAGSVKERIKIIKGNL